MDSPIKIVNEHLKFPKVNLKEPLQEGFILISAEVDKRTSFWGESKSKKNLIKQLKELSGALRKDKQVQDATLFKASLFPPGRGGAYLQRLNKEVHDRYDVVLLIETISADDIEEVQNNAIYQSILSAISQYSSYHFVYSAENIRRIDRVNHQKQGVFLFNYFVADNKSQNLKIWEYTAGWFQDQTQLDNSTLFSAIDDTPSDYRVINHCRWDGFMDILPSLIFKKSFKTYVLDNFEANHVAAIPILYKLA